MKHIKKVTALLMCALIALSACLTASAAANDPIKPTTGPYTLKINLYEAVDQAIKELDSAGLDKGNGEVTIPNSTKFMAYALDDVKFDIYNANPAKDGSTGGVIRTVPTTKGVATFETETPGTYWVKVNSLPKAVAACLDIKDGFAVDLPMTNAAGDGWLKTVNVYPKVDTVWGIATFKKVDEKGNAITSSSAKFDLYRIDIPSNVVGVSNWATIEATLVNVSNWGSVYDTYETTDGTFTTGRIPYGAYKLVETQAPTGYALDQTPRYFIIDGLTTTQNIIEGVNTSVTFNGTYTIGEVKIINKELGGIEKTLTSGESASIGDTVTWKITGKVPSDAGVAKYTKFVFTDTLDAAFKDVSTTVTVGGAEVTGVVKIAGNTVTVDLKDKINASSFTIGDNIVITISATLNAKASLLTGVTNTATLTYDNGGGVVTENATSGTVKTGGYTFKKVDSADNTKVLQGAKFKVYKSDNTPVTDFYTKADLSSQAVGGIVESDDKGLVHIYGLAYGSYYLVEVKAPKGYELNGGKINFTITEATSDKSGNFDAELPNKKKVELPFTGGVGAEVVVASGVLLMVAAGFVLKKRVK